ncbi:glycoside hydrolase family 38 C-terminal domain-containing protein [uncultured Leifsonia sp.]|uniref:alpha-mannosidase n=1 Tax=uncultured Leifsonia sp. TaxID=340359 RepID=UPI0025D012A9|nr:glycoside hydrolase family 38 C-terminal domain-containing protein [uncultured Leifsonia sp.]
MYQQNQLAAMRVDRFVRERLTPALERAAVPVAVEMWEVPDEPVPFAQAVQGPFEPFAVGRAWGRPWGTVWFRVSGTVPAEWEADPADVELVVDLGFTAGQVGFQAEGLVWTTDGTIVKALEPLNDYVRLQAAPGESFELFIEAAANPDVGSDWSFRPTPVGRKATAPTDSIYTLRRIDIVHRDTEVWELIQDIFTIRGLAAELPETSPRRAALFAALEDAVVAVDPFAVAATASRGRAALAGVLASPAAATAHRVFAVGHAHIDSAWLWPVRETIRKCARTFSNVLDLMDQDPDFVFACSSAQQFAWMQQFYPELFDRIRVRVAEGRFVPVGGMWVESDTNLPGSEAMARQFVEGKRFFLDELGHEPREVWLPDSFGYSGALPQIARAAGMDHFLTQKISWNEVNRFPHHTFEWEGIDGTRIFTHFPPVDTYNSVLSGEELARAERNFADKGRANTSLVPFGFGDGGGGPTREMVAAAARTADLEGSPTVRVAPPEAFFEAARAEFSPAPVWAGELYLEFHRGTYTSQARTKQGNRRSEALLHEAELWAATAAVRAGAAYPAEELRRAWRTVLLQQFHDILPGSSIGWVHDQAVENYAEVARSLEGVIARSLSALAGGAGPDAASGAVANASPFAVDGVAPGGIGVPSRDGAVRVERVGDTLRLVNDRIAVTIDADGLIPSIVHRASGREAVPAGTRANLLQLFRDTPTQWDAWDVDVEYRLSGEDLTVVDSLEVVTERPELAEVRLVRRFGDSAVTQTLSLAADSSALDIETRIDWHERQRMLKLGFPVDVHTTSARSEIQFGHIDRPTHTNTSWDVARFETSAHRWVHVGEPGFGVGIANDATYGHDITRHEREGGGTYSFVRQTLLRAPLFPDPEADQGTHILRSSIVIGDVGAAIETGYRVNLPLRPAAAADVTPLLASSSPAVVIETVKLAEDGSGDVVARLYEARGSRAQATLTVGFPYERIERTDLLERPTGAGDTTLALRPFELVTLRFVRS